MYTVYILRSLKTNHLYIGTTSNLQTRLSAHNAKKVRSTKAGAPYTLITSEQYMNKTDALRRERQIKESGLLRKQFKRMPPSSSLV